MKLEHFIKLIINICKKKIMVRWYKECVLCTPVKLAVILNILIAVITIGSCVLSWKHIGDTRVFHYSSFPILLHILCLCMIFVIITILTYVIFFKDKVNHWFSTLGFFFYILFEFILVVNIFSLKNIVKTSMYIEGGLIFGLLFIYTQLISCHNERCAEEQRIRHEAYVEKHISSTIYGRRGRCVRIPLKEGTVPLSASSFANPIAGPSNIQ